MPGRTMAGNIKEFTSPVEGFKPSDGGMDALAHVGRIEKENLDQAGRAYGDIAEEAGSTIDNYEYMHEVSQGSAGLAVMHNNMITAWNKTAAATDPNDNTIQQQFMDQANDQLSSWQDGFQTKRGQAWAENQVNDTRNHLWEKTSADMSIRAGEAIQKDYVTTLENRSQLAGKDISTLDHSLGQVDALIAAHQDAGYLDQKQRDSLSYDMKNELVKGSLKGLADNNPQQAMAVLKTGKFDDYLSAGEQKQLDGYAQTQLQGKQIDQQRKQQSQQFNQDAKAAQVNGEYIGKLAEGQAPLASQIISDPNLTTQQKTAWIAKNGILALPESTLHAPNYGDSFDKATQSIYGGQGITPDGLLAGIRRGEFTPVGAAQLQKLSDMSKTPQGRAELNAQKPVLTYAQSQIVKGGGSGLDPKGEALYNQYLQTFYQTWDANIKKGITPAQMSDPKDKEYLGNLAQQFKRNDAQAIADVTKVAPKISVPSLPAAQPSKAVKAWVIKDGQLVPQ